MEKLRVSQAVIVEGRYDKIKLEALVEGVILTTEGFRIYRDKELQQTLRALAESCGVIVLTDSDRAGFQIRSFIKSIAGQGRVVHAYVPDIPGKERRKAAPSKEGKLGVEGMDTATLREALRRAGIEEKPPGEAAGQITKTTLYLDGFTGGQDSRARRQELFARLGLPGRLSVSSALPLLNQMLGPGEYRALVDQLNKGIILNTD